MTIGSSIAQRVADAANEEGVKGRVLTKSAQTQMLVQNVLEDWGAVKVGENAGGFGLESLGEVVPERNRHFNPAADGNVGMLVRGLKEQGHAPRHITQIAESCLGLFDSNYKPREILAQTAEVTGKHQPLARVIGRTSSGNYFQNDDVGLEAFGDDVNRLATDDRLTMSLMMMRPWENIMDKNLARVNDSSPVVTIRIPSPEAWDWATTQQANSTMDSRNGPGNTNRLRDLFRNPTPVNTAAKKIVPVVANDSKGVLFNGNADYYKSNVEVSLMDLSRTTNKVGFDHVDRTDLVSDGGTVDAILVSIVDGSTTETFKINTRPFDLAMFVPTPSNKASGQRQVVMEAVLPIKAGDKTYTGGNSTIAAKCTDFTIQVAIRLTATLNIQTGSLQAHGTATMSQKGSPNSQNQTYFNTLVSSVSGYSVDLRFDEENQRKANMSIWVQYYEQQFVVPRSRIFFTEYSLTQDVDENAVAATSTVMALGNGRRGLDTIVNALNDIAEGSAYAEAHPDIAAANAMDDRSFASALVKPTVLSTSMDFEDEEVNTLNESTRLSEIHGRFRARLLAMSTVLMAKSLMLNQYKPGDTPVLKAWVHSSIADIVIGILDYHPTLNDEKTAAAGADYSMVLPNGYRLDIVKSNFDCLQNRLYVVPVIESDMASVLSAASIRDCGTVTTNYTPTNRGSVVRRVATTTREIVMMSNKLGLMFEIKGLSKMLGEYSFAALPLTADYTESLTV